MKPLPESFKSGTAFWERMENQDEGLLQATLATTEDKPYTAGDTLYRREEWRAVTVYLTSTTHMDVLIEYSDGYKRRVTIPRKGFSVVLDEDFKPACDMPPWAGREFFTVVRVEAVRGQVKVKGKLEMKASNDWGWYVTIKEATQ